MGLTHDLGCMDCKVRIWIGQGGHLYFAEKGFKKMLTEFMYKHEGHHLVFHHDAYWEKVDDEWNPVDEDALLAKLSRGE